MRAAARAVRAGLRRAEQGADVVERDDGDPRGCLVPQGTGCGLVEVVGVRVGLSVGDDAPRDFSDEGEALAVAEARIRAIVSERALAAGADAAEIDVERDVQATEVEGRRMFIEARLTATASGRPRIAE